MGKNGFAIAAGHQITAEAGAEVLRAGGNAVDAAIASALTAMVAEPVLAGLLGGGFMLIREPSARTHLLDFFVQTPKVRRPEGELDFRVIEADFGETTQSFHIGTGAIATSGLALGLVEAHDRFGRTPLPELVEPARRAAREGVEINGFQASLGKIIAPILKASPETRALMCADGEPLGEGARYRNPEFADVLEVFGHEGSGFVQRGEVAAALLDQAREGGHLIAEDLSCYRTAWHTPLIRRRGEVEVALNPGPSLGGMLIAFGLELMGHRPSYGDRAQAFELTGRARVEAALDDGGQDATARVLSPELVSRYRTQLQGRGAATRGTTHISVTDSAGLAVSMTLSNGEGCGLIVPGTGIMANNMLGEEDLMPRNGQDWRPDQRLASMMCPMAMTWPDGRCVLMGSGGSNRIRTALTQVAVNMIDEGMPLYAAIRAPRLHVDGLDPTTVDFELPELQDAARAELLDMYPEARAWERQSMFFGGVHAVARGAGGSVEAVGDPRRAGVAITG